MLASVHGISQARILKWVAISFSRGYSQPKDQTHISCIAGESFTTESLEKTLLSSMSPLYVLWTLALIIIDFVVQLLSHVWPFATPWTAAHQASLSLTISWSLLKFMSELVMPLYYKYFFTSDWASLIAQLIKNLQCGRPGFHLWVGKIPWRKERLPIPVFLPGEFHGLYNPWGCKESDTTERLSLSLHLISCLFIFWWFPLLCRSFLV